jgi:hypothetical protein
LTEYAQKDNKNPNSAENRQGIFSRRAVGNLRFAQVIVELNNMENIGSFHLYCFLNLISESYPVLNLITEGYPNLNLIFV